MSKNHHIFSFLTYIQPIWYFNLRPNVSVPYWVDYRKLNIEDQKLIAFDHSYKMEDASLRDAAYQAFQRGLIIFANDVALEIRNEQLPIEDEYYFLRKYYNLAWSWYVLVVRLLELNNPLRELRGFLKHKNVERFNLFSTVYTYEKVSLTELPLVSIVLPTLNRYSHLANILKDLEHQRYNNFEVIVVDQSHPFQPDFYTSFALRIKVIHQPQPGLWKARNTAIREAIGELIAFTEDDVRVKPDWLEEHLICLKTFNVDISAGVFFPQGSRPGPSQTFYHWAKQFASGNALVRKSVFNQVGLFDLQFEKMRMGDGEFGLRCYLQGIKSMSNPFAFCEDVKASEGGLRQMGSWDGFRPTNWFGPRPIPSVLYLSRRYFGRKASIFNLLINVPASIFHFKYKRKPMLLLLASFLAIFISPLLLYQVFKSWSIASDMIAKGPEIDELK